MASFALPLAISGISALAGLFGGKKKATTQQTSDTTTNSNQNYQSSTLPQYDSEGLATKNFLLNAYLNRATTDPNLDGYTGQGIQNINNSFDLKNKALQSILAARGLTYSPVGASIQAGNESNRIGQGINFLNQIPLLRDQIQGQKLGEFSNFFHQLPVGQIGQGTSTGTSTSHTIGNSQQNGNGVGGLFSGLATGIGLTQGLWNRNPKDANGLPVGTGTPTNGVS